MVCAAPVLGRYTEVVSAGESPQRLPPEAADEGAGDDDELALAAPVFAAAKREGGGTKSIPVEVFFSFSSRAFFLAASMAASRSLSSLAASAARLARISSRRGAKRTSCSFLATS